MNSKSKTVTMFIATFLLGIVLGFLVAPRIVHSYRRSGGERSGYREMFHKRLELSQTQMAGVDSLLDFYRMSMDEHRVAIQTIRDSLRTDIRRLLTDRQQKLYRTYIEEMNKRENRRAADSIKNR